MTREITQSIHHKEAGHVEGDAVLCAALTIAEGGVPEWIHLLPAGEIRTRDGRGPYFVKDLAAIIAESLPAGEKLVIDENHATDLAAPDGRSAPARGWIVELQARADGLWGRVEWTAEGRRLVEAKEYRGISPNILHDPKNIILAVQRASLVNLPNLRGLSALHQETNMDFMQKLREALGLSEDAGEDAVLAAVRKMGDSLQSAVTDRDDARTALAAAEKAKTDAETALQSAQAGDGEAGKVIVALQSELKDVTTRLNAITETNAINRATAFVDGAIKAGRVGVKPLRERYIAMHQKEPEDTEALVNAMPILGPSGVSLEPPAGVDGKVSLNATQLSAAKLLGISPEDYRKTLDAEREAQEAL